MFAKIAQCAKVGGGIGKGKKVGYCVLRRETEKKCLGESSRRMDSFLFGVMPKIKDCPCAYPNVYQDFYPNNILILMLLILLDQNLIWKA